MKVFCSGFNLFGNLIHNENVLEGYVEILQEPTLSDVHINFSYTVLQSAKNIRFCHKRSLRDINIACENINHITSNDEKILILDEWGYIFKIEISNLNNICPLAKFESLESSDKIILISSGSKLHVGYSESGSIFNIPNKLRFKNRGIIDIQCGREHCLLLDIQGNVFSFGRGSRGQLGHGILDDEVEPRLVDALGGIKIEYIAAGGWHSCAVSKDGDVYTWGWNSNGQLGIGKTEDDEKSISVMATPHVIDFENTEIRVEKISCGNRHTVVLLGNNILWGCGWNKYKQLKSSTVENIYRMTYLHEFSSEAVADIKCGPWSTAALCK